MKYLLVAITLVLVSCGSTVVELAGSELEPAEAPESVAQATWGLPFIAEFPPGYWAEGAHRYRFVIDCPQLPQGLVESNPVEFRVTPLTLTLDGPVYIRLGGLSTGIMMPANVGAINPAQPTIAAVTFLGLTEDVLTDASANCDGVMEFDGDESVPMSPGDPFRP